MEVKANLKHLRLSPRKARLVIDVIRGLDVNKAIDQLRFINKRAVKPISKLLQSAIANAKNNFDLDVNNLYIKEIRVDEGRTLRRWLPRAHGRATVIRKRCSHVFLTIAEIKATEPRRVKKEKIEAPIKLDNLTGSQNKPTAEGKKVDTKEEIKESETKEKEIIDPRLEGRGQHAKIEGRSHQNFAKKIFRRKSG